MSEERSVAERLAGLETQQKHVADTLGELRDALSDLTKMFSEFMARQVGVDQRLLSIEQDLRDGRQRFKAHEVEISAIRKNCDESKWIREAGADHLKAAGEQEKKVGIATNTAAWAERAVWLLIMAVLAWWAVR